MNTITKLINLLTSIGYEVKFHDPEVPDYLCITLLLRGDALPGYIQFKYDYDEECYILVKHEKLQHRVMGALMYLGLADYDDVVN